MNSGIFEEAYTLSNGIAIPKLGLGTWFIDDDKAAQAVRDAVSIGYRHIDTAQAYGNERGVGEGVQTCGLAREKLFITSKLAAETKTYDEAAAAIDESLRKMNMEYIDRRKQSGMESFGRCLQSGKAALYRHIQLHAGRYR